MSTNRLRMHGTDNLLRAGQAVGVKRFIAQSYIGSSPTTPSLISR
jgi:hypothetical protein